MKKQSKKIYILPVAMLSVTVAMGVLASIPRSMAEDITPVDDEVTITVDSACTMGQTTLSTNPTLNPGETGTIGTSRISAYCNDANGYDIYAIGYTNGEYGNTSMQSTESSHTIPTGLSGEGSYWNMYLTSGTSTTTPSYIPAITNNFTSPSTIPNDFTKVATYPSTTIPQSEDPLSSGSYFTTTYTSHISTTQPAGVYTGQVQYVMVHPVGAPKPEIPYTMQNTAPIKSKLTNVGDSLQATDTRDGKKYWVTREADGNIWMTQNLDLGLDSTKTYTPADTDLKENWIPVRNTEVSISNWKEDLYTPYSFDPDELYIYSSGTYYNDEEYTSLIHCQSVHPDCSMRNHVGNFYNWSAAVASNNTAGITAQYTHVDTSICPAGWRLPTGIDGYTTTSREWETLLIADGIISDYNDNDYATGGFVNIRIVPLWLVRSGYISGDVLYSIGYYGNYWSSTTSYDDYAYQLGFYNFHVRPNSDGNRYSSGSVRCVAR